MPHKHTISCLDDRLAYCKVTGKSVRASAKPLRDRVLAEIAEHQGTINNAMIASKFRLKFVTVERCANKLKAEGKIERDDEDAWVLSDTEHRERREEKDFQDSLKKLLRK